MFTPDISELGGYKRGRPPLPPYNTHHAKLPQWMLVFTATTETDAPSRQSTAAPMPGAKTLIYEGPFQFSESTSTEGERSDGAADEGPNPPEFGAPLSTVFPPTISERWAHASDLESTEADSRLE